MFLKQIYSGEKGSEYGAKGGKGAMSMGSPTEPQELFQYLKFKKEKTQPINTLK